MNNDQKAQLESIVSCVIALAASMNGTEYQKNSQDLRETIREDLMEMLDCSFEPDLASWPYVKDRYFYDVYLSMRAEEGTLTMTDETRTGLSIANFTDAAEYHKHQLRVSEKRKEEYAGAVKTCNTCGLTKPASKFKKRGGATCNSCNAKKYRDRKAQNAA